MVSWSRCKVWLVCTLLVAAVGCTESETGKKTPLSDAGADTTTEADAGRDVDEADDTDSENDADAEVETDTEVAPECVEDQCGVCDDDPTNDCLEDCNGDWGGTAVLDECGTCNADPADNCVQDCAGNWGGSAVPDECGICDDDPSNDCAQDCAGDWGGAAVEDACGVCDDDPSNDCDCAGTPGGSAVEDQCGTCDADPANDCALDCAGDWGGSAALDGCGTCDDDPSNDCVDDCNGVPAGPALLDNCGVCDEDPTNDCTLDCAGDWGGTAVVDQCGTCDADPSNDCVQDCAGDYGGAALEDQCGTCDADPANDCVQDCHGDYGGSAVFDLCGRCVDGNTGAQACPTVELSPQADATVQESSPTTNLGSQTDLQIRSELLPGTSYIYLRFDLSSLPANAIVQGVELQAQAYDGHAWGDNGNVYSRFVSDDAWGETSINWNNAPAADPANLGFWWLWYDSTPVNKLGVNNSAALAEVVQRENEGDRKLSLRLHSRGYDTDYRSREYADAAQHPTLRVGYLPSSSTTLEPSADAWVDNTATNNGDDLSLEVSPRNGVQNVFLRFDLSGLPAGAQIVKATLSMTAYTGHAHGGNGNVYTRLVADDSWAEDSINGDNAPSSAPESLGFWWLWYNRTNPSTKTGTFTTPELRDAVQAESDDDGQISLRLNSTGYSTSYRSREYSNAGERPQLKLIYVIP